MAAAVQAFLSTVTNKLDAKRRVSVPAAFRQILNQQNLRGFYCFPSFVHPALEGFGEDLLEDFNRRVATFDPLFSADYEAQAQAVTGETQFLGLDDEGRARLPDEFLEHAGITDRVVFLGLGKKFQIWEPQRYEAVRLERLARARELRTGGGATP